MPDYALVVIYWIAGLLAGAGIVSQPSKTAKNICAIVLGSLACAFLLVFFLGVTAEVLRTTNVSKWIDMAASFVSPGDRRPVAPTPTPTPTPVPDDINVPAAAGPPDWLIWLLFTSDKEG